MEIIPVLDLMGGVVVGARMGQRDLYRPISTPLAPTSDPVDVMRGLLSVHPFTTLYVADLDAIEGIGNHFELVRGLSLALPDTSLWIDAGFSDVADCAFWLPLGATLVIGSEGLDSVDDWREIHAAFGEGVVLSLDYDAAARKGPEALFDDPALWPLRVIVMDLGRVGTDRGPDIDRLKPLIEMADGRALFAAGGVRNAGDLAALAALPTQGAVIASALHHEAVTQKEIAAL